MRETTEYGGHAQTGTSWTDDMCQAMHATPCMPNGIRVLVCIVCASAMPLLWTVRQPYPTHSFNPIMWQSVYTIICKHLLHTICSCVVLSDCHPSPHLAIAPPREVLNCSRHLYWTHGAVLTYPLMLNHKQRLKCMNVVEGHCLGTGP